jgi:hypothetical protein
MRDLVIPVKMKDIFANKKLFLSESSTEIYQDQEMRVFIDFFGFDKLHTKMLIGQKEMSLIKLIKHSMIV